MLFTVAFYYPMETSPTKHVRFNPLESRREFVSDSFIRNSLFFFSEPTGDLRVIALRLMGKTDKDVPSHQITSWGVERHSGAG
jgi:hypothetical protein